MLRFASTLRNGSSRLRSRSLTRCIPNHQMILACSNTASASQVKDVKNTVNKTGHSSNVRSKSKFPMVNLVFDTLANDSDEITKDNKPNELKMVEDLLRFVDNPKFSMDRAKYAVTTLREWVESGKIKFKHFERDPKYLHLCKILEQNSNKKTGTIPTIEKHGSSVIEQKPYDFWELEQSYSNVNTLPIAQHIVILSGLVAKQRRIKPLLLAITSSITQTKTTLSMKNIGDILYTLTALNFPDEALLKKLCNDVRLSVKAIGNSSIIGSIVTSLGMLRYRDIALMDLISDWAVQHKEILRTQDLCALLMTLATVGHTPINSEVLIEEIVSKLSETDMTRSSEWLDVVWSLTILNKVTPEQLKSVLNAKYIEKILDLDEFSLVKQHKLLNINAAAKLLIKDYPGPFLPENCKIVDTPMMKPKSKQIFVKSITDALSSLFPSRDHFRTGVITNTGFVLDVEFFLDKKCVPLLHDRGAACPDALRIGIIASNYHDYCIGDKKLLGPVHLYRRLLQAQGYRLLDISHEEFHTNDKLLNRITYINDRLKSLVK